MQLQIFERQVNSLASRKSFISLNIIWIQNYFPCFYTAIFYCKQNNVNVGRFAWYSSETFSNIGRDDHMFNAFLTMHSYANSLRFPEIWFQMFLDPLLKLTFMYIFQNSIIFQSKRLGSYNLALQHSVLVSPTLWLADYPVIIIWRCPEQKPFVYKKKL